MTNPHNEVKANPEVLTAAHHEISNHTETMKNDSQSLQESIMEEALAESSLNSADQSIAPLYKNFIDKLSEALKEATSSVHTAAETTAYLGHQGHIYGQKIHDIHSDAARGFNSLSNNIGRH